MSVSLPLATTTGRQFDAAALPPVRFNSLYVHVPFCGHKCHYCDFYSITRQSAERMARFVDLILAEADLWHRAAIGPFQTLFFGGGTPSLLPPSDMVRLINGLTERFGLATGCEFTVECNPSRVNREYFEMLVKCGVNRVSLGMQSSHKSELGFLERDHNPSEVPDAVLAARQAGLRRINVDLIYAIPGQTMQSWEKSLSDAVDLGVDHISAYGLTYESNTALAVRKRLGEFSAAPEDLEVAMMRRARELLEGAGYLAYEISNFSRPGETCRHNLNYWHGGSYLALGPSGASHAAGHRWKNRPHLGEWERAVETGQLPIFEYEHLLPAARGAEMVYLMLRTSAGVNAEHVRRETTVDPLTAFARQIDFLDRQGLIQVSDSGFTLTAKGLPVADAIAAEFLAGH